MHKNELDLRKYVIDADKFGAGVKLIQHAITAATILGSLYIVFLGLGRLAAANPEALGALSHVIEKLQISAILGNGIAALTSLGFVYERTGKKRAIRKLDEARRKIERGDPYKGSSNLDENGHTPK